MQKQVFIQAISEEFIPSYASKEAAGADLRACISEEIIIQPGESKMIPTGIIVEIPEGFEIQIRPRSGLALKNQITVLNTPGTIDRDYRGQVQVILINHGKNPFIVLPKMRIAQMVLSACFQAVFIPKQELLQTERGGGGFGHTGTV
jgi:dUTP pyrophosphatase